jgi:hypothetical protein
MLSIIDTKKENLIAAKLSGTLTKADIETLHPMIHAVVNKGHKVDWYIELAQELSYDRAGLMENFKVDALHLSDYGKIAIVGNKKWQEWISNASNYLTSSEIKFYDVAEKDQALQWAQA